MVDIVCATGVSKVNINVGIWNDIKFNDLKWAGPGNSCPRPLAVVDCRDGRH